MPNSYCYYPLLLQKNAQSAPILEPVHTQKLTWDVLPPCSCALFPCNGKLPLLLAIFSAQKQHNKEGNPQQRASTSCAAHRFISRAAGQTSGKHSAQSQCQGLQTLRSANCQRGSRVAVFQDVWCSRKRMNVLPVRHPCSKSAGTSNQHWTNEPAFASYSGRRG